MEYSGYSIRKVKDSWDLYFDYYDSKDGDWAETRFQNHYTYRRQARRVGNKKNKRELG